MLLFNCHPFYIPQHMRGRFWRHMFCIAVYGSNLLINDKIVGHQYFRLEPLGARNIGLMFKFMSRWYCRRFEFHEIFETDIMFAVYDADRAVQQCRAALSACLPLDYF